MLTVAETVSVTSQILSAAGLCAQATQAQARRGLGRAMGRGAVGRGSGLPCGQRAACESTGDGRERGRRPCLRASASQPRLRGSVRRAALSHGRRPRSRPALAHRGPWARASSPRRFTARLAPVCSALRAQPPTPTAPCVPAPARLSGRPLPAWQSLPRAPHGTPAHGATALESCACVACAHRRRQRLRLRRSPCPGRR